MIDKFSFYTFPSLKKFVLNTQLKILDNIKIVAEIIEKYDPTLKKIPVLKSIEIASDYSLLPGGHQTLFVWLFSITEQYKLVIKPYTLNIFEIILHYLSILEFQRIYAGYKIDIDTKNINLRIMDIFMLGTINIGSKSFPFIVQEFSNGERIQNTFIDDTWYISNNILAKLFKHIAQNKFVVDPYLSNWRLVKSSLLENPTLEYIDLIFSVDPIIKTKARDFLTNVHSITIIL